MQNKKSILIYIAIFFPIFIVAQDVIGVMDAVNIAMKNNHDIKIAKNNIKIAENNASVMNSGFLPSLNVNGELSDSKKDFYSESADGRKIEVNDAVTEAYNYGVFLNYRLFDGLARYYNYKKFKLNYTLSELKARAIIENTLIKLVESYYEVAKLNSKIDNQKRTIDISNERYNRTKSQFKYGQATKLDLLRSEVDKNNDSIRYINSLRELELSIRDFNVILARDVYTKFDVDTTVLFNQDIEEGNMMSLALEQNVDYLIALQNIDIANVSKKHSISGYIPNLNVRGGYSANNSESTAGFFPISRGSGYNVSASLNWNLFDGGKTQVQMQNAKILKLNAQEALLKKKIELEREVSNAFINYKNSLYIMKAERKNMETNRLNFMFSDDKFSMGQISSIDYRKAQVDLEDSINRYNEAKYSAKLAELRLMKLAGLFIQEVNSIDN